MSKTIKVAGVEFSAEQVKSATIHVDGRDVHIYEKGKEEKKPMGFKEKKK